MEWVSLQSGHCMILLVEVAGAGVDQATSGLVDISGICDSGCLGSAPAVPTYLTLATKLQSGKADKIMFCYLD